MRRKALIVDDQPDIRKLIMMTMESEDFDLHEADNGESAWTIAQKLRPDQGDFANRPWAENRYRTRSRSRL